MKGDPNVQTVDGETPLHVAVIWNRTLIVKMLLVSVESIGFMTRKIILFFIF